MNSLEIKSILDELKIRASNLASMPEDHRIVAYRLVDSLFLKLEGHLREQPGARAASLLDEIKLKVILMARLDEATEDTDAVLLDQAESLVNELEGLLCGQ